MSQHLHPRGHGRLMPSATALWLAMAASTVALLAVPHNASATTSTPPSSIGPAPPSSIGNEFVQWIAVSPAYQRTGLVAAFAAELNCPAKADCGHLWVSHDGGSSWHKATAANWQPSRL